MDLLLIILGTVFLMGFVVPMILKFIITISSRRNNKSSNIEVCSLFKVDYDIELANYIAKKKGQGNCEIINSGLSLLEITDDNLNCLEDTISCEMPENKIF